MKKLILLSLCSCIVVAQEDHFGELVLELINKGSSWDITFTLSAVSTRWDADYEITEDFQIVSDNVVSPSSFAYFDYILDPWAGINPIFAIGLYKISAYENETEQAFFYMDWRTSYGGVYGDANFKYDVGNNLFRNWENTQTINYSYQTLWNLVEGSSLQTSGLEDYWDNCLAVTADNGVYAHPRLVWGPYPETLQGNITGYKIYRSPEHGYGQPPGNFSVLTTVDPDVYHYVDDDVTMGGWSYARSYYVTCIYEFPSESLHETDPTNTVEVRLAIPDKRSESGHYKKTKTDYKLEQNYPNPFNPSTVIKYSLPERNYVNIRVYNILGKEIAMLVNEVRNAGNHSVEFNAEGLPSGVYLYKVQSGDFLEVKKMILQK